MELLLVVLVPLGLMILYDRARKSYGPDGMPVGCPKDLEQAQEQADYYTGKTGSRFEVETRR